MKTSINIWSKNKHGKWNYYTIVNDTDTYTFYKNGEKTVIKKIPTKILKYHNKTYDASSVLKINRVLSKDEISMLYNYGSALNWRIIKQLFNNDVEYYIEMF